MDKGSSKDMQRLLRFAVEQQQDDKDNCVQIDEDKKVFLNQVLSSMSTNVTDEFLKAIHILQQDSLNDQDKVAALGLIRDHIDNIDFANSFIKIEGAEILISFVKNANRDVCIETINIIAEMSQNNPVCQQYFFKYGVVQQLIEFLTNEDSEIVASALYALSALTRHFEPALTEFIKKGGPKLLINCLSMESSRVFSKSCSLISSMSSQFSLLKDEFAKLDTLRILTKKLHFVDCFNSEIEMALRTMAVLIESRYCNPSENEKKIIGDILKDIVKSNENLPECEEIVLYSNSILKHIYS